MTTKHAALYRHIGGRIRERRELNIGSQEYLARRIDCSKRFLSEMEDGKRPIALHDLYEIADIFGVEIGYFFEGYER